MGKIRILIFLAIILAVAALAQTQPTQQKTTKRSASSSAQTTSTTPSRGMTATPNAPQPDNPSSAAAAATAQATNPYYGTPTAANPQGGGACGSGGPGDDLASCQQQMAWLHRQRAGLMADRRGTQQRIASLQSSGTNDTQIAQLQTHLDSVNQQISSLDARIATVRDRIAQLGGATKTRH